MRRAGSLALLLPLGLTLAHCGGAADSNLLDPGRGVGKDAGGPDTNAPDVVVTHDVMTMLDTAPPKDTGVVDTAPPPPKDTGPPDVGPPPPMTYCGPGQPPCVVHTNQCCVNVPVVGTPTFTCEPQTMADGCAAGGGTPVFCDKASDCPGQICCGIKNAADTGYKYVACATSCTAMPYTTNKVVFCEQGVDMCPAGTSCNASTLLPGFFVCN